MKTYLLFLTTVLIATNSCVALTGPASKKNQARAVIERTCNRRLENLTLKTIDKVDNRDVYEYSAEDGILTIAGSSPSATCRGFYDYIRSNNLGMIGWEGARLKLPTKWPTTKKKRIVTPFKIRHCYNVVTAGYTFPYWTWERWEQELDWLALHGFNMIMAPVATEAIATRVWRKLGLTQAEIDKFYVGPAHLPWQRMGNIQNVDGGLDDEWHQDQIGIQKKILKRMRELGMEPVVQSFAGFVPPDIKRIYPDTKLHNTLWNGGFGKEKRPVVIMPDNPLFKKISKMYMSEWQNEFGEAKYYLVDSFNEMHLPKTERPVTELLADYGKHTFAAIKAGNPDGIWVIQGWMFNYQRYIWNKDTVKALLSAVPNDRMFVLDYANDYNDNWDEFNGFHGKPWAMGYVPNMGGKTAYTGKMSLYATAVERMLNHPMKNNNVGFTISGEGLENNQVLYELMSDSAWSDKAINLDEWTKFYSENRYSSCPNSIQKTWDLFRKTCYSYLTPHPKFGWQSMRASHGSANRDPRFTEGVMSFFKDKDKFKNNASYCDDAVEMAAISLSLKVDEWFALARQAHDIGDNILMDKAVNRGLKMMLQVDKLLESHSLNRLDRWLALARKHSKSEKMNDRYEHNARRIITVWGPPVNDYSARMWSGLIRDFYQPRMKAYFEGLKTGKGFNRRQWEEKWVMSTGISKIKPYKNPVDMAAKLVKQAYSEKLPPLPKLNQGDVIGDWMPNNISTNWQTVEWTITEEQLKSLLGVKFIYKKGNHRLDIKYVEIVADGKIVAREKHFGYAGIPAKDNVYFLKVPEKVSANNSCSIRAMIRSNGGNNSFGKVVLINK